MVLNKYCIDALTDLLLRHHGEMLRSYLLKLLMLRCPNVRAWVVEGTRTVLIRGHRVYEYLGVIRGRSYNGLLLDHHLGSWSLSRGIGVHHVLGDKTGPRVRFWFLYAHVRKLFSKWIFTDLSDGLGLTLEPNVRAYE